MNRRGLIHTLAGLWGIGALTRSEASDVVTTEGNLKECSFDECRPGKFAVHWDNDSLSVSANVARDSIYGSDFPPAKVIMDLLGRMEQLVPDKVIFNKRPQGDVYLGAELYDEIMASWYYPTPDLPSPTGQGLMLFRGIPLRSLGDAAMVSQDGQTFYLTISFYTEHSA